MKTTIEISDPLLKEARKLAARDRTTLRALVERGLRQILSENRSPRPFKLGDGSFKGRGLTAEAATLGWDGIRELVHERRGE